MPKKVKTANVYQSEEGSDEYVLEYEKKLLAKDDISREEILMLTKSKIDAHRWAAVKQMCPCKVLDELNDVWDRLFNMVDDPCPEVRDTVLHNICDGSPPELEERVLEALEKFNRDTDKNIKRKAHKVMAAYKSTGKWNVL